MDFDFSTPRIFSAKEGEQYLENYPSQPKLWIGNVHLEQALSYFEAKQWFKAIAACQRALTISADVAEAHKIWGDCLQRLGKTSEAIGQYAQALELNPDMAEVYLNMGSLFAKQKKWNQAINHFQQALNINPRIAVVYHHLANIYHQLGEYESTTDMLYRAYELEPDSVSAQQYFVLGNMLLEQDKVIEAITCYRRAVQLKRGFYEAYEKLNDALRRRDEFDRQQEESLSHQAIQQEPERESCYYKSLEVNPDDPEAYIGLAKIKEAQGEKELAVAFYKIALQMIRDRLTK